MSDSPREEHTQTAVKRWTVRPLDLFPLFEEDWQASRADLAMTVVRFDDFARLRAAGDKWHEIADF